MRDIGETLFNKRKFFNVLKEQLVWEGILIIKLILFSVQRDIKGSCVMIVFTIKLQV